MQRIEVLLACYQGESHLPRQLDSLLEQSYTDFQIIARDDGSSDQTAALLQDYAKQYPGKFHILPSDKKLGVIGNFNALLEFTTADYIFFADQDDIWIKNKIELSLQKMEGINSPLLLHTDLQIVDAHSQLLHPSFLDYIGIEPAIGKSLNRLLVQNMVTGCTVAINKALKNLVYPFPEEALMHDWWMALVASACGQIITLSEKTVLYRQHGRNAIGAYKNQGMQALKKLIAFMTSLEANTKDADLRQKQGLALYKRCQTMMPENKRQLLKNFLEGPTLSLLERKWSCLAHQFYRQGLKKMIPYLLQNRPY